MINQFNEDDIEIIISTMNQLSLDFLIPIFPDQHFSAYSILIINQTNVENQLVSTFDSVRIINSFEKGLSKSRNLGIRNAIKSILILTDDDVVFTSNFKINVVNAFNSSPEIDVFKFQSQSINKKYSKKYPEHYTTNLGKLELLNTMSIELVFKKKVFEENTIFYDENFGLGATFAMGEENSLLLDFKKKNVKIAFIPEVLCYHDDKHTANTINKEKLYYYSGAVFYRNFGSAFKRWIFLKLFFELKHRKINFSLASKLYKQALLGKNDYEKIGY